MTVTGTSNLPVAPREHPWNASAAKRRVLEAAAGNVANISRAFLWRSNGDTRGGDPREASSWHLGFCDIIDGRLHIIPKGIAMAAGRRGVGSFAVADEERRIIEARITAVYDRVRSVIEDWPQSPFRQAAVTAGANGEGLEGIIAFEGITTGDRRRIEPLALSWGDGPWPLVFDREEMDHSGATVGTIDEIRRVGKEIWAKGALSDSEDPETQMLVTRVRELFEEGAIGVSISMDEVEEEPPPDDDPDGVWVTRKGRIRSVAVVDEAAFDMAQMSLVASLRVVKRDWFTDPRFADESDERLVWQEPERPEEERQLGCPLTITAEGQVYGHAALWGRCHVGHMGTCIRPPKEPVAYRGFLTGERVPGVPTGPLVMKTRHAPDHLDAGAAGYHYDHTGYAVADVTIGSDAYGIWVAGAVRPDATEADIEILRASALSGDWRPMGGKHRLVGLLAVNAPGFRVARAIAASGTLITSGPGCNECDEVLSFDDRLAAIERVLAQSLVAGVE